MLAIIDEINAIPNTISAGHSGAPTLDALAERR